MKQERFVHCLTAHRPLLISSETPASQATGRPSNSRLADDSHPAAWVLRRYCSVLAAPSLLAAALAPRSTRASALRRRLRADSLPSLRALSLRRMAPAGLPLAGANRPSRPLACLRSGPT